MIREILNAYKKIILSNTENKKEKIEFLNNLIKMITNKNNVEEIINEYNIKYLNLYINADPDISLKYDVFEKNELAEIIKRDLINHIGDLIIYDKYVYDFVQLLVYLSKKKKEEAKENITLEDFLNIFRKENNIIINVFGESGTGKTYTTIFLSLLLNYNHNDIFEIIEGIHNLNTIYFNSFEDFKDFVKSRIENNNLNINAVVFDEFHELNKNDIKIMNRIRFFNYQQKPIIYFIITHEKNEFEKLKRLIDYYIYFFKKYTFRIYKKNYMIRTKMRLLFPSLYKPKIKNYVLNDVNIKIYNLLLNDIKYYIENREREAKLKVLYS